MIGASRVLELLGELFQLIGPGHLREAALCVLLLLAQPTVLLLVLGLRHSLLQNLICHCFFLLLFIGASLLLRNIVAVLVLLLLIGEIVLLATGRHVVAAELLAEKAPLHLLHHVLLEVQGVQEHHVLVWIHIVSGHVHKVLPIVQYDALSLG